MYNQLSLENFNIKTILFVVLVVGFINPSMSFASASQIEIIQIAQNDTSDSEDFEDFEDSADYEEPKATEGSKTSRSKRNQSHRKSRRQSRQHSRQLKMQDLTPEQIEIYRHGKISTGSLVAGGLLGTFIGLGVGHIVYGKYTSKGWIFTVGEIGSYLLAVAGASAALTSCLSGSSSGCSNGFGLYYIGAFAFVGFRIWEIVDVWTLPSSHNSTYEAIQIKLGEKQSNRPRAYLTPLLSSTEQSGKPTGYGLQVNLSF